jgi:hypothetical protein
MHAAMTKKATPTSEPPPVLAGELGFDAGELARLLGRDDEEEGDGEPDPGPGPAGRFEVVVECRDAAQQIDLLRRLSAEGFACKAVVS